MCQVLRRQVRCLPLCLAGRSLRAAGPSVNPGVAAERTRPRESMEARRPASPSPRRAAWTGGCSCWVGRRLLGLRPPQREKGASDIHRVVVSNFLLLSRSSSEREQCPKPGPLPGGRPPSCTRRCPGGHDPGHMALIRASENRGTVGLGALRVPACCVRFYPRAWSKSPRPPSPL